MNSKKMYSTSLRAAPKIDHNVCTDQHGGGGGGGTEKKTHKGKKKRNYLVYAVSVLSFLLSSPRILVCVDFCTSNTLI